ncbi:glycoside hydrolase family 92 protein [Atractiella rhizophila]|nr:glycoside hydrolase family 92 protein [Atractiella rhizophila]
MGLSDDSNKYAKRSQNFLNLWNPNVTVPDAPAYVQGFIQPKFSNGTFNHTDPRHCSIHDPVKATCFLNNIRRDGFYESSPIVYSQYAPHDTAKLIEIQGGPENFIQRLDWIFDEGYFDSTNEPSQQIPFMYHYAHRPALSTFRSRQTISTSYNTSLNGLPGNDDSGAMASYVFFYLVGLYPLPATQQFLLSSPYFPSISFYNPLFESWTTIKVSNFDTTGKSVYVKDVKIDGKEWKSRCWIPWSVFENGSTVELEVTDDMSLDCGAADDSLPASLSTGGYGWVNF